MWSNNTRNTKNEGEDQIEVFIILNGYENIDFNMFFLSILHNVKYLRGHHCTLVKDQSRLDIREY